MDKKINILHLEDSLNDSELIHSMIKNGGIDHDYFQTDSEKDFIGILEKGYIDIILSDFNLPDFSGIEAFGIAREKYAKIPFIFVSGTIGEDYAINAMVNGATDYVFKNKLERLVPAIKRAMHEIELNLSKSRADEELRVASVYSRSLLEANLDPLVTINAEGIITDVNKSTEQITGVSRDRLIGTDFADYFTEPEKARAGYKQVFSQGVVIDYPLTILNVSGSITDVLYNATIYRNETGEVQGILASARDITKQKQEEEALIYAKEKAEASDKLKTTFLNNISHEVRTPLNGILGFADIILNINLSEADKIESLNMLHESSDRLLNTINNYMDISLIASGNLSVNIKNFFPEQILSQIFDKYKTISSSKKLILFLEIPSQSDQIAVNSDPEIFQKIMSHLLSNAISFTENGTITFGYLIHDTELEFFVRDTGIGIAAEALNIIFEHFMKEGRDPSRASEGSGLGLSIAKGMVEALGG